MIILVEYPGYFSSMQKYWYEKEVEGIDNIDEATKNFVVMEFAWSQ